MQSAFGLPPWTQIKIKARACCEKGVPGMARDLARVNPERDASAPAPGVRARVKQLAKRVASDFGRVIENVSRLYGYSGILSGINTIFVSAISLMPLTNWDDEQGVPRANVLLVSVLLVIWGSFAISFACAFNIASIDPYINPAAPHYCERYAWSGTLTGNIVGGLPIGVLAGILPAAFGYNPRYYMLDIVAALGAVVIGILTADRLMWYLYTSENGALVVQVHEDKDENEGQDHKGQILGNFGRAVLWLANALLLAVFALFYPTVVLPYYRASSTSEYVRVSLSHIACATGRFNHTHAPRLPALATAGNDSQLCAFCTRLCKSSP